MHDDSEHHQIKNSNKCSLYGDTMPLRKTCMWHVNPLPIILYIPLDSSVLVLEYKYSMNTHKGFE